MTQPPTPALTGRAHTWTKCSERCPLGAAYRFRHLYFIRDADGSLHEYVEAGCPECSDQPVSGPATAPEGASV